MVGEAHGFRNSNYGGCRECHRFSYGRYKGDREMERGLSGYWGILHREKERAEFEQLKDEFVAHFNKCHVVDDDDNDGVY